MNDNNKNNNKKDDFMEIFQECELCHDIFPISSIKVTLEGYFYCEKCLSEYNYLENQE